MSEYLYLQVFKILLQSETVLTGAQLAKQCNVSVKTISNTMPKVREAAAKNQLHLRVKKGIGYLIEDEVSLKAAVAAQIKNDQPILFEQERIYYILHCLLNEENCRVKYLEFKLHLSRPTIYKTLEAVETWLQPLNICLERTRSSGLKIICGEKRHRLAIAQWYNETNRFIKNQSVEYADPLHLKDCLATYLKVYNKSLYNEFILEIQKLYGFEFLKYDLEQIVIMMHISIQRLLNKHTVSFPNGYVALIEKAGLTTYVRELAQIVMKLFKITLPDAEAFYLFSIVFASETYNDKQILADQKAKIQISLELHHQINTFIAKRIPLNPDEMNALLIDIESALKNEIIYQVRKAVPTASDFCARTEANFPRYFLYAQEIYEMIQTVYPIKYVLKFHCSLTMLLAGYAEKVKTKVTIAFVCNCGSAEQKYMLYMIDKYIPDGVVSCVFQYNPLKVNDYKQFDCDVIVSTLPLCELSSDEYLLLPPSFTYENLNYISQIIHRYFVKINQ